MLTLTHEAPAVNPTPSLSPLGWDVIEADRDTADRLAWHNDADANDVLDGYPGPGWQDDESYVPTPKEEAQESGYSIGLTGARPGFNEAFTDPTAAFDGRGLAFTMGRNRGNREHAARVGYELGLGGLSKERPASIHRLVAAEFAAAWDRGFADYCERQREMAAYFDQLDWEADELEREAELEAAAREAGGWDRLIARTPE